jgi:phytoene dehydrogenase-like protein
MTGLRSSPDDVIVVGGGLSGLTAATYLAQTGLAVTLLEKNASLGGRGASTNWEGFCINRGIHALYSGGAASRVLREFGVSYTSGSPKATFALQAGNFYPASPAGLLLGRLLTTGEKAELLRFFTRLPRLTASKHAGTTVADWLSETARTPGVLRLLRALAVTLVYSTALDVVSAELLIDKLQRASRHPVQYLDGGWGSLVAQLQAAASEAGARIETGTAVAAVEQASGRACGVRLRDGTTRYSRAVLVATTPRAASRLLDDGRHPGLGRAVGALLPARLACLDVVLGRLPEPRRPVVQDLDQGRFLSAQSLYSRVAPEGAAIVYCFKPLDPREESGARADEQGLEALLDAVQPGWRACVLRRSFLPGIEAVGALPLAGTGGFAGRPAVSVDGVAGLYLAGDWVGREGFLLDAALASAREAAAATIAYLRSPGSHAAARPETPRVAP